MSLAGASEGAPQAVGSSKPANDMSFSEEQAAGRDVLNEQAGQFSHALVYASRSPTTLFSTPMTDLLAFKAGRAFRREGSNSIDPSPTKGAIILQNGDDGLLHFLWKDRFTNRVEEVSRYHGCQG